MEKNNFKSNVQKSFFLVIAIVLIAIFMFSDQVNKMQAIIESKQEDDDFSAIYNTDNIFKIISSTENIDIEPILLNFAQENNIALEIEYSGTIDIMEQLNSGAEYDAVWTSNSIWMYMLNDNVSTSDSKSTSINPVVFGITKSKAEELDLIGKEIYTKDIVNLIKERKIKI